MKKSGRADDKVIAEEEKCAECEYWVTKGEGAKTFCVYPIIAGEGQKGLEMDRDGWCRNFNFND